MVLQKHIIKVYLSNLEGKNSFDNEPGIVYKDRKHVLQWSPTRLRKNQRTGSTEVREEKASSTDCEGRLALFLFPAFPFFFCVYRSGVMLRSLVCSS